MKKKRLLAAAAGLMMTALVFAGVIAIAAEYGTQGDPLVSLSYINSVFAPELRAQIDVKVAQAVESFNAKTDSKISSYRTALDSKAAEFIGQNASFAADPAALDTISASLAARVGGGSASNASFAKVVLSSGQTLVCSLGTEVMLRLGNATCVSTGTPGLIDTTDAKNLPGGGALSKNHLYMCTVEGRGVYAASGATLFVRGAYSIK